uniref:Uncharacterized protein n=1 Tax=Macaca mulatta TaxID=9544 RepID=A0A5F8A8Q4_MACMU
MCCLGVGLFTINSAHIGLLSNPQITYSQSYKHFSLKTGTGLGWVQWLTPVITADHEVRSSRPAWPTWGNTVSTKNTKISQVWWCTPVVPATQEAEAEESLEPRRRRLQ